MTFSEATDRLMAAGVTLQEIAEALGVAHQTARVMRLDPSSDSHRRPPEDWRPRLARLANERGAALQDLAEDLGGTGE